MLGEVLVKNQTAEVKTQDLFWRLAIWCSIFLGLLAKRQVGCDVVCMVCVCIVGIDIARAPIECWYWCFSSSGAAKCETWTFIGTGGSRSSRKRHVVPRFFQFFLGVLRFHWFPRNIHHFPRYFFIVCWVPPSSLSQVLRHGWITWMDHYLPLSENHSSVASFFRTKEGS